MNKIICLVGISGSGKSTYARELVDRLDYVVVSRDKIREMLYSFTPENISNYYNSPKLREREDEVTKYQHNLIRYAIRNKSVIIDNTNLQAKYLNSYKQYGVRIEYSVFYTPLEECIERNKRRIRQVDESVIKRQHNDFLKLRSKFNFASWEPTSWQKPAHNPILPDCYVFDIDNTLAEKGDRSPYDWAKVGLDTPKENIVSIQADLACMSANNHDRLRIIICSGRDEVCRSQTEKWLEDNRIYYDELHMRPEGSQLADYIEKETMWRDISTRFNIICLFDDRNQVVDHARKLGFTVAQVAEGDF